jgi:hypothetical protein
MTLPSMLRTIAAGLAIAGMGVAFWRRKREQSCTESSPPDNDSMENLSASNPLSAARSSLRPAASLKKLQKKGVPAPLPDEPSKALQERIQDLISALTEAHSALIAGGDVYALNLAAQKIVYCHWITGHEWRRHVANFGAAVSIADQIDEAWTEDARPLVQEISRLLDAQPPPALVQADKNYDLACAACCKNAVTFREEKSGVLANGISKVTPVIHWQGKTAQHLIELLEQGSARAVLDYLSAPGRLGCPAYCPECKRVYCREHYSVEEIWSGSWHEASYATCPLGHKREFE